MDGEEVVARTFGDEPVGVEEESLIGTRVGRFEPGEHLVEVVERLGARIQRGRGRLPYRDDAKAQARRTEEPGQAGWLDARVHEDQDGRVLCGGTRVHGGKAHPTADHDPHIRVGVAVAAGCLEHRLTKCLLSDRQVQPEQGDRAVEAVEMVLEPEDPRSVNTKRLVDAVSVEEAAIEHGNLGILHRDVVPVEVCDPAVDEREPGQDLTLASRLRMNPVPRGGFYTCMTIVLCSGRRRFRCSRCSRVAALTDALEPGYSVPQRVLVEDYVDRIGEQTEASTHELRALLDA